MSIKHLNFNWKFKSDFKEEYFSDFSSFSSVAIPHQITEIPLNYFDESVFFKATTYVKILTFSKEELSKILKLTFLRVASCAEVFLNGQKICTHKGGYTSFSVILKGAHEGENILLVKVDSNERADIPPFGGAIDYLCYGGIYREVTLEVLEKTHISSFKIWGENLLKEPKCHVDFSVFGDYLGCDISWEISRGDQVFSKSESCELGFSLEQDIPGVVLWDTENPVLYKVMVAISRGGEILDQREIFYGFRVCEFKCDGFYLNGKKLKLRGLNRHQSFPYVGYAVPKSLDVFDANFLKFDLCCNIVRTSHYPQSQHFLNRCDEIGLLAFVEAPGWQFVGDEGFKKTYLKNLEEMICENFNHPSIVIWGVRVNESQDDDEFYLRTNELARSLDKTRATGGVRNFGKSKLLEDVYTYNDFLHSGDNDGISPPSKIVGKKAPYLITEFCGHMFPTKSYDTEERRVGHVLRHAKVLNEVYGSHKVSGGIGWCMSDYNTHKDFGAGDRICYHGVSDMFRIKKLAGDFYSSQGDTPYLAISTEMQSGDLDKFKLEKIYIFTNLDYVNMYKNDKLVGKFSSSTSPFPNLPHPPIEISDTIGSLIEREEGFSRKDAQMVKKLILKVADIGFDRINVFDKVKLFYLMKKYSLTMKKGVKLFGKYIQNWGETLPIFKFEGFKDGELVKTATKAPCNKPSLRVAAMSTLLRHEETFDMALIHIFLESEWGNVLTYAHKCASLECEGNVEIIGPKVVSLEGGAVGTFVKTTGKGVGSLKILVGEMEERIDFQIE